MNCCHRSLRMQTFPPTDLGIISLQISKVLLCGTWTRGDAWGRTEFGLMNTCYVVGLQPYSCTSAAQGWMTLYSAVRLLLPWCLNVPATATLSERTLEHVAGFLSLGQTRARSAVPRSSSSAPAPAAKQHIGAAHVRTRISLTLQVALYLMAHCSVCALVLTACIFSRLWRSFTSRSEEAARRSSLCFCLSLHFCSSTHCSSGFLLGSRPLRT